MKISKKIVEFPDVFYLIGKYRKIIVKTHKFLNKMKKTLKTLALLLAGAALSFSAATMANASNNEAEVSEPAIVEAPMAMIECPNDQFFYQNIISMDGDIMSDVPIILDFNATWCGPCQKMKPILNQISNQYSGRVKVYSIDVDRVHAGEQFFEFNSIPYMVFITPDGDWSDIEGSCSAETIKSKMREVFKF